MMELEFDHIERGLNGLTKMVLAQEYSAVTMGRETVESFCHRMQVQHAVPKSFVRRWLVEYAEQRVHSLLNNQQPRIITAGPQEQPIYILDWRLGTRGKDAQHMRELSVALTDLANAIETEHTE